MPYKDEFASKASHFDIVKNPDVAAFLDGCDYLTVPSDDEGVKIADHFVDAPPHSDVPLPSSIIAFDGSRYESSINDRLPSTKVGYIKVSSVLIKMDEFNALKIGSYVDPFRVAKLQDNTTSLTITVPSANIRWQGKDSVRDGFRSAVDTYFYGEKTRFKIDDPKTSLRTTLFHLGYRRAGSLSTSSPRSLKINKCPTCKEGPVEVEDKPEPQWCPYCGAEVFPTDALRLWEEVSDYQSNLTAITRLMLIVEHLMPIHYTRYLVENNALDSLAETAFFIDGPLSVFGPSAWLHLAIMRFLDKINLRLQARGRKRLLIIGLQKSGQVYDHVQLIDRYIERNTIFPITDEYRYKYILQSKEPAGNGFGYETYYGQDFIYKTGGGRTFILGLLYPFAGKLLSGVDFISSKVDLALYTELPRALALVNHFETDLYENAVVPIALANKYTAISLVPGGRVLDILTRRGLGT